MARPNKRIEFNEKTRITNNIIDDMSLEGLTPEQIEVLKKRLDDTLANYEVEIDDAQQVLTEDANMKILDDFIASKRLEASLFQRLCFFDKSLFHLFTH